MSWDIDRIAANRVLCTVSLGVMSDPKAVMPKDELEIR